MAVALLKPADAAKVLAISERKLWDLTNRKKVRCVRIGRAVRYDPTDLQTLIENSKGQDTDGKHQS